MDAKKIRISSNYIVAKLLTVAAIAIFIKLVVSESQEDFKALLTTKLVLVLLIIILIYFFTRPRISYDVMKIYIKGLIAKERSIPLANLKSIETVYVRGETSFSVKFLNEDGNVNLIQFTIRSSERWNEFIDHLKKVNNKVSGAQSIS